jgi:L-fuconolactonase
MQGVVGWADLANRRLGDLLDEYQHHPKFRGLIYSFDRKFPKGLDELVQRDIPLDVTQLAAVLPLDDGWPALRLVIDNLGAPFDDDWARHLGEAAQLPQVCCKFGLITGLLSPQDAATLRPYVQHALAVFGPHRLMFGSGWPVGLPAATWKQTLAAFTQSLGPLPVEVREQLLGGAAARFYGIAR